MKTELPLPDNVDQLKAMLRKQHVQLRLYEGQVAGYEREIERLKAQLNKLRRQLFGQSSERRRHRLEKNPRHRKTAGRDGKSAGYLQRLPDHSSRGDRGPEANAVPEAAKNKPVAPCHSSRKPLPTSLPRETVRIAPTETSCPACGGELAALGETVSEQLDIINNAFRVIETVRPKLACRKCDAIVQALAEKLSPLAKALNRYILAAGKGYTDDTKVPVLAPGSGKTRTARL